jgi:hypothetical protein
MKNLLSLAMVFMLISLSTSCDDENLTAFSFSNDYATATITVDPTNIQGDIDLGVLEIESDIQGLVSGEGVGIDNLKSIKVTAIKLEIEDTNSTPYTFDLVTRIKSEISNLAGTSLIEFAGKDPVPTGGQTEISLDVQDVELINYFKQTKFKVRLKGFTTGPIDHSFNVKLTMAATFKGEVLK